MITLIFNGQSTSVKAPPHTPLLYALRDQLDCKAVRFGCGSGHCGACTVGLNGQAVQSCDTPMWAVENQAVDSVEQLVQTPIGSVVHQAFLELQAAQCGYCLNGILVSVILMFQQSRSTDQTSVLGVLDRHLCRCGTHTRILKAVELAAQRLAGLPASSMAALDQPR